MLDLEFVTKFVLPPILGGIAGFFSPWLKYYFENLRLRREDRRLFIIHWRNDLLASEIYFNDHGPLIPEETYRRVIARPSYASLKPHLSISALEGLKKYGRANHITIEVGASENPIREILAAEIDRLERRWGII